MKPKISQNLFTKLHKNGIENEFCGNLEIVFGAFLLLPNIYT